MWGRCGCDAVATDPYDSCWTVTALVFATVVAKLVGKSEVVVGKTTWLFGVGSRTWTITGVGAVGLLFINNKLPTAIIATTSNNEIRTKFGVLYIDI